MALAKPVGPDLDTEALAAEPISHWKLAWWRLNRDKVTLVSAGVLGLIILLSLLAPLISPYDPTEAHYNDNKTVKRIAPIGTSGHLLGTDEQGRDMVSRLLYGGRLTLLAGFFR